MNTRWILTLLLLLLIPCSHGHNNWNYPYTGNSLQNTGYGAFASSPKTLDPARAYSSDESQFIAQIYEPVLQYHYLKRPFALEPLTAAKMPMVTYYDQAGNRLPDNASPTQIAYSIYDIFIKPGIYYQPHPAFVNENWRRDLKKIYKLSDFPKTGTRELTADDYVYQIKRLASPKTSSPIFGFMAKYIWGLEDYSKLLQNVFSKFPESGEDLPFVDLRQYPFEGAKVIDRYHYQIKIKGIYPQFLFWLAMPFFSPVPWEVDAFYSIKGMSDKNITFDWYPVGTGPYYLTHNNPNKEMVLERNPNFRGEIFPTEGTDEDRKKGFLINAGKMMPFIDKFVFSLDKETIPRWNKFLQGYYDRSGIAPESFDQAIKLNSDGKPELTDDMKKKGIKLQTDINPSIYYLGFNMLDDVVGGYSEKKRKLRQAIAAVMDYDEYIAIFLNGRGVTADGPIPPGIFGYEDLPNQKENIKHARQLLAEAGYPKGINPKTNRRLILNYDTASTGTPDDKARLDWMRKQFDKLGIDLNIRGTDYNRFQDKVRRGNAQIFSWGWIADYPDPENFLFLLYGPNGKVKFFGENASNYLNPEFDRLFEEIKTMPNNNERLQKIRKMVAIARQDQPWVWGYYPIDFILSHVWMYPEKPQPIANNTLKYLRLNSALRADMRSQWNRPILWPFALILCILILMLLPLFIVYWRREHRPTVKKELD